MNDELLNARPRHTPCTQITLKMKAAIATHPTSGATLAHSPAMAIQRNIRMRANRVINCLKVGRRAGKRAHGNISKKLGVDWQIGGSGCNIPTGCYCCADFALVRVKIGASERFGSVIRSSSRIQTLKSVWNKHLKFVEIIIDAAALDMPIGVGASSDGLRLHGRCMHSADH